MSAKIISGKEIAGQVYKGLEDDIRMLKEKHNIVPGLAVVIVGEHPASLVYVRNKKRACEKIGVHFEEYKFMASTKESEVMDIIDELNNNPAIHGILVQLPLPDDFNVLKIQRAVYSSKDVDGFSPENMGKLLIGETGLVACTCLGVQELLVRSNIEISGKKVVIIGRSNIVGKPLAALFMQKKEHANATVTVCHSRSKNLPEITRQADILIAALGRPLFVTGGMVTEGAVVIDVGMNRLDGKLVGDVNYDEVKEKASYITTVPGGVGPMTIAMLMHNTVKSAKEFAAK